MLEFQGISPLEKFIFLIYLLYHMQKYPDEVIALNKQGKKEVRLLLEKGRYVKYTYLDPKTNKIVRVGKESIILKPEKGKTEHLFIVPVKGNKSLLIRKLDDKERKILNKNKVIEF